MNVMLISQCEKRALTETRRILDQFAERRGDRTWQTSITLAGLETLKKMLRQNVRKNSAIACHWIRGKDHSELIWIVGDKRRFSDSGAVPTNTTTRDVLKVKDENDWRNGEYISLVCALAALLHDLGKACAAFQEMLVDAVKGSSKKHVNVYRHEWISLRLFQCFVEGHKCDDAQWLQAIAQSTELDGEVFQEQWLRNLVTDGLPKTRPENKPFLQLASTSIAKVVGWLIVSHHRLPQIDRKEIKPHLIKKWVDEFDSNWNNKFDDPTANPKPFWTFPNGLPLTHPTWRKDAARIANGLLKIMKQSATNNNQFDDPFVMHISRLSLMLADHHYSSYQDSEIGLRNPNRIGMGDQATKSGALFANTNSKTRQLNQRLDEHLVGVSRLSRSINWTIPSLNRNLPRLGKSKLFKKRITDSNFSWQNKAFDVAESMSDLSKQGGAFVINMASTGKGKTLANAKIMYALSGQNGGMRCAFAMGLRTLTMQTGRSFQALLGLGDDELSIRVGDSASRTLFEVARQQAENSGSESLQTLNDESCEVLFEDDSAGNPAIDKLCSDPRSKGILQAPILVCTIDHLTPATEADRGGRQIVPMLRLLTSDLVLDEPDDFDISDFPALSRLVNWAGLLGARVLLSSATLPPSLVNGLYEAYCAGRRYFNANRTSLFNPNATVVPIPCIWVDEYKSISQICTNNENFKLQHLEFVSKRGSQLALEPQQRKFVIKPFESNAQVVIQDFAAAVLESALHLHNDNFTVDTRSNKRASFGLIRVANISRLYEVAKRLFSSKIPEDFHVHLCTYHSQFPLIQRSKIEQQLDQVLNRKSAAAVFDLPQIKLALDGSTATNQIFIVLGSPVTEVGRDHDYDWAVVEPSSMRSLIQLLGRVRRHRKSENPRTKNNVVLLSKNIRHFTGEIAFIKPGFEDENNADYQLNSHDLSDLLPADLGSHLDARPRIQSKALNELKPESSLIDLEHSRIAASYSELGQKNLTNNAAAWWSLGTTTQLTALLPIKQPFRNSDGADREFYFKPNQDGELDFVEIIEQNQGQLPIEKTVNNLVKRLADDLDSGTQITSWCKVNYLSAVAEIAESQSISQEHAARRFGRIRLRESDKSWAFHEALGFVKS
jgi:CRISPR-associated endonuclease/helicase Cas3